MPSSPRQAPPPHSARISSGPKRSRGPAGDAPAGVEERKTDQVSRSKLVALARGSLPPMFSPDSLPPIIDEVPSMALVRGAVVSLSQTPTPTPDGDLSEEEVSTGLFESWDWDEAPPQTTSELAAWDRLVAEVDGHARRRPAPMHRREPVIVSPGMGLEGMDHAVPAPELGLPLDDEGSLEPEPVSPAPWPLGHGPPDPGEPEEGWLGAGVRDLGETEAIEFDELVPTEVVDLEDLEARAAPQAGEPRPAGGVDWPPPRVRPGIDYPPDWSRDELGTMIVIDPHRSGGWQPPRSRVLLIDFGAWLFGFVAMFFTGLITTASAALVLFALTL
jgi:hypothetical protein